ncbi:MAG TPA: gluconate 2-dehydrogenase subunit 3 family protein [Candidatus Dormibacteraeota bacterium]|nr:gluconate 2-dehydrogenase subunit 3 family protein [Candidatus Dormibacteraeota bacterium]
MSGNSISRRDILKTLAMGAAGGTVLQVIPAQAAEYVHQLVHKEKVAAPSGKYTPKYFPPHQYVTLIALCDAILPKDEKSGGALDAGAPEFIDLLTSENEEYQRKIGGGLLWLDGYCSDRYENLYLDCTPEQKTNVLDLIAVRKNAKQDHALSQGISFFAFVRNLTCDAYYTSKIGIADLQYIGNTALREFPGCPPPTEA